MKFDTPLIRGTLLKRYKRFLADVKLDSGEEITATCPNTGSMLGLKEPGMGVWLSTNDNPKRKYRHTWEMVEVPRRGKPTLVGVNTGHPNKLVSEAIEAGRIPELSEFQSLKREQKYGENSRIDILLEGGAGTLTYVEVKNVHMSRQSALAEFPDSVTERGAKHLRELANMVRAGHRAVMMFLIQRQDCKSFTLAGDIDSNYLDAFAEATEAGVEALAYSCRMSTKEIKVAKSVPIKV